MTKSAVEVLASAFAKEPELDQARVTPRDSLWFGACGAGRAGLRCEPFGQAPYPEPMRTERCVCQFKGARQWLECVAQQSGCNYLRAGVENWFYAFTH